MSKSAKLNAICNSRTSIKVLNKRTKNSVLLSINAKYNKFNSCLNNTIVANTNTTSKKLLGGCL